MCRRIRSKTAGCVSQAVGAEDSKHDNFALDQARCRILCPASQLFICLYLKCEWQARVAETHLDQSKHHLVKLE